MAEEGQQQEQETATEGQEGDGGTPETDWKAEAAKWQGLAKKHEDRAKGNSAAAKRLAELEAASQSELERAQAAAQAAEAKAAAAVESIATAKLEAALTGLVPDPEAVVGDLNVRRFLADDGTVDAEKVAALRQRYAALAPPGPRAPARNAAQGASTRQPTLAEIAADAEKSGDLRMTLRAKSQQLTQIRNQQG